MAIPGCAQPCLWHSTLALLLLIVALTTGLPCRHLRSHEAFQLLKDMAPSTTEPCNLQNPPFFNDIFLPNNLSPHQAAIIVRYILQDLFHTLTESRSSQHWPSHARNHLLNKLDHHIHHLKQCFPDNALLLKGPHNPLLTIKKYFSNIHLFLQAHNHSACAWDHVRLEAIVCFQHVDKLMRRIKHQAALDPTKPTENKHPSPASTSTNGLSGDSRSPGWDHLVPVTRLPTNELMGKGV